MVACQTDVIKHTFYRPIFSDRLGKWAYALIEYDLAYESLKYIKDQIVANFIVEHRIDLEHDLDVAYVTFTSWKLYFDGSVCKESQGVDVVLVSLHDARFEFSN